MTEAELKLTVDKAPVDAASASMEKLGKAAAATSKGAEGLQKSFEKFSGLDKHISKIGGALDDSVKSFNVAQLAAGALAAAIGGLTLGALTGMVKGVIESAAGLQKLSVQTGLSVEELSKLQQVAKMSGTDFETVTLGTMKFQKALAASANSTSVQSRAFKELGIDTSDSSKSTADFMTLAAQKLDGLADGWQKNAIATALYGKAAKDMNVINRDLAENGDLVAKVTTAQAEQAEHYERTMRRLSATTNQYKQLIGMALLPVLDSIATEFLKSVTATGKLDDATKSLIKSEVQDWAFGFAKALGAAIDVGIAFWNLLKGLGTAIGTLIGYLATAGEGFSKLLSGDFKGAWDLAKTNARQLGEGMKQSWDIASAGSSKYYDMVVKAQENINKVTEKGVKANKPTPKNIGEKDDVEGKISGSGSKAFFIKQAEEILKLNGETDKLFHTQTNLAASLFETELKMGKYGKATFDATGKLIGMADITDAVTGKTVKAFTVQEVALARQNAGIQDVIKAMNEYAAMSLKSDEAIEKMVVATNDSVKATQDAVAEHQISIDVLKLYGKTNDDVAIAINDRRLAEAKAKQASLDARLASLGMVDVTTKEYDAAKLAAAAQQQVVSQLQAKGVAAKDYKAINTEETDRLAVKAILDQINPNTALIKQLTEINRLRKEGKLDPAVAAVATRQATTQNLQNAGVNIEGTGAADKAFADAMEAKRAAVQAAEDNLTLTAQEAADKRKQIQLEEWQYKTKGAAGVFDTLATLSSSGNKRLAAIGKAAAIAQATMNAYVAISAALAGPFPMNYINAAAIGLVAFANVAKISGVAGFKSGGYTGEGGTSEPAGIVHSREFVINAAATSKHRGLLEQINRGSQLSGYEIGGFVGNGSIGMGSSKGGDTQINHITVSPSSGNAADDRKQAKLISDMMEVKWVDMNSKAKRGGGVNNPVSLQF